jgi:hypothetical protein
LEWNKTVALFASHLFALSRYIGIILLFLLCSKGIQATSESRIQHFNSGMMKKKLQLHVQFLSSESLEGRLTGSKGEQRATQYVADFFHHLGLKPAGDEGSFFQEFSFTSGVSLDKNNLLSITDNDGLSQRFTVGQDWFPLACSDNASFNEETELVFVGYGISAPSYHILPAYDSYHHLNVKNKWVVVFRDIPEHISKEQKEQMSQLASPRHKVFIAKEHGAKGIIFISGPRAKVKNELTPLSFDSSLSGSGIIALAVKDELLEALLNKSPRSLNSLKKIQDSLDKGQLGSLPVLRGIKLSGQINIKKIIQHGRNVLAKLEVSPEGKGLIVVGAHVDHLGHGSPSNSRANSDQTGMIHPGADDNASGVASVLEVAAALSAMKSQGKLTGTKDILFAAWSGEELGLLGSSHFIASYKNTRKNRIDAAINLDMVGHLRKYLVIQGLGSSTQWHGLIEPLAKNHPFSIISQKDPYLPTDSTSFYVQGIPGLNLFTGAHDNYHTPRDTPETLNYQGIKDVSEFVTDLVLALEKKPDLMSFHQVPKSKLISENDLKIYLGTIPNYASAEVSGVALSGVTKNSPAEQAGLKQNDVIISLAGITIHDIYDYTFIIDSLHVGEPVPLLVLRGGKTIELSIRAQYR